MTVSLKRLRSARLPLVPFIPAIVLLVAVATALAVGFLALHHLQTTSNDLALTRAQVLSRTIGARLRAISENDRDEYIGEAARRSGAEILVCSQDGRVEVDATSRPPPAGQIVSLLVAGDGVATTQVGRTAFSASSLGAPFLNDSIIVFVPAPYPAEGSQALFRSIMVLTLLLAGVAAAVAYIFARDLRADVTHVRGQIQAMAAAGENPAGSQIRIRVADQVGMLTDAFNTLVERFEAAERAFRQDLQRVASLDRDRSAFLGALSHELRTPLNAILGFADVLLADVDGQLSRDARENLEMVRASGSHLRGLVDDILEMSALESGQLRLSRAMVDVRAVAEDVINEARARVIGKHLSLGVSTEGATLVFADERRVWQILSNLVGNAVKFTVEGSVQIQITGGEESVSITVTDTGPGIPEQDLDTIFDEFQQSTATPNREKGTGLGLFIARRLVLMHGGEISVKSTLGNGAQFTVRLPVWSHAHGQPGSRP